MGTVSCSSRYLDCQEALPWTVIDPDAGSRDMSRQVCNGRPTNPRAALGHGLWFPAHLLPWVGQEGMFGVLVLALTCNEVP